MGDMVGGDWGSIESGAKVQATDGDPVPATEIYTVDIPVNPALTYRIGLNAQREAVESGGVYDDQIVAVAVYDRPWADPEDPGGARIVGTIYLSSRTNRVYRIDVEPAAGGTLERLLEAFGRLTEQTPRPLVAPDLPEAHERQSAD